MLYGPEDSSANILCVMVPIWREITRVVDKHTIEASFAFYRKTENNINIDQIISKR